MDGQESGDRDGDTATAGAVEAGRAAAQAGGRRRCAGGGRERSDRALARLAASGVRLTPQRRAVAAVVLAAARPLTAAEVFVAAREACPGLGLTTVYRTLDLLGGAGLVRRVHGDDGCEAVVPALATHGHTVVCRRCGRSEEFTACDACGLVEAASRETGFVITGHFLQLEGLCAGCAAVARREGGEPA